MWVVLSCNPVRLWCYHGNETSSAVLSHGTISLVCYSNFWICGWNPSGVTMETKLLQQFFHLVVFVLYVVLTFEPVAVADPGEGPWGPELPPYFSTKMMPEGPKKKLWRLAPLISGSGWPPTPPLPYLKVRTRHLQWMKPLQQHFYTVAGLYVVLSREPVDEILLCDHSNET